MIVYPGATLESPAFTLLASNGGQGSYSFADQTVFGARGIRAISHGGGYNGGVLLLLAAGAGGGARPSPTAKAGSKAAGYSPNGLVVVRLSKT